MMDKAEHKIRAREARLLKSEARLRYAWRADLGMGVCAFAALIVFTCVREDFPTENDIAFIILPPLFLINLYLIRLKLNHISSIKMYRSTPQNGTSEQNIRQVSSESALCASPDEPST